jgi:hypothetical protein
VQTVAARRLWDASLVNLELLETIPGWFWPSDIALFDWFLSQQTSAHRRGDLTEIGTYLGKSAVLIGSHLEPGETFTVIDLFEGSAGSHPNQEENEREYPGLQQEAFELNYRRLRGALPVVIKGDSGEIVEHAAHGTHRFVHVDASHLYEHVCDDISSAKTLLQPDGVVAFDDIRAVHTPGVWAAVWEAIVSGGLRPIVTTEHKLYATWGDSQVWQDRLQSNLPASLACEVQRVLGRPLVRAWTVSSSMSRPASRRIAEALVPPAVLFRVDRLGRNRRLRRVSRDAD